MFFIKVIHLLKNISYKFNLHKEIIAILCISFFAFQNCVMNTPNTVKKINTPNAVKKIGLLSSGNSPVITKSLSLEAMQSLRGTPSIGINYTTWFGGSSVVSSGSDGFCNSVGWNNSPLQLAGTKSLLFSKNPIGYCYNSFDPQTAQTHAPWLSYLNVDYVIFDATNESKGVSPAADPSYQAGLIAMRQFIGYAPHPIRSLFMFSVTSWAQFECPTTNNCTSSLPPNDEVFTLNSFVVAHFQDLYTQYEQTPSAFVTLGDKPVVLIYVASGSGVMDRTTGRPYFKGSGSYIPSVEQLNPILSKSNGSKIAFQDAFSVRYTIVDKNKDFSKISNLIWMWNCPGCSFSESSSAWLLNEKLGFRDLGAFLEQLKNGLGKLSIILSPWNSFSSSGDEKGPYSTTLEPNTTLYKVDSTPGNRDPYFFYNNVASLIHSTLARTDASPPTLLPRFPDSPPTDTNFRALVSGKLYSLKNAGSQKCLDITGGSSTNGTRIQQYDCIHGDPNQTWKLVSRSDGVWSFVSQISQKCLDFSAQQIFSDGNVVQQWNCSGAINQSFSLIERGANLYQIKAITPNECLDVPAQSIDSNGALLHTWACGPQTNQDFYFVPAQ
ncbi:MAG: RICIN domain-containing protein [Bacteriovorax sp.]|nr:RICIN domain-containing protein [Bacteriovorax sp.]